MNHPALLATHGWQQSLTKSAGQVSVWQHPKFPGHQMSIANNKWIHKSHTGEVVNGGDGVQSLHDHCQVIHSSKLGLQS